MNQFSQIRFPILVFRTFNRSTFENLLIFKFEMLAILLFEILALIDYNDIYIPNNNHYSLINCNQIKN